MICAAGQPSNQSRNNLHNIMIAYRRFTYTHAQHIVRHGIKCARRNTLRSLPHHTPPVTTMTVHYISKHDIPHTHTHEHTTNNHRSRAIIIYILAGSVGWRIVLVTFSCRTQACGWLMRFVLGAHSSESEHREREG